MVGFELWFFSLDIHPNTHVLYLWSALRFDPVISKLGDGVGHQRWKVKKCDDLSVSPHSRRFWRLAKKKKKGGTQFLKFLFRFLFWGKRNSLKILCLFYTWLRYLYTSAVSPFLNVLLHCWCVKIPGCVQCPISLLWLLFGSGVECRDRVGLETKTKTNPNSNPNQ